MILRNISKTDQGGIRGVSSQLKEYHGVYHHLNHMPILVFLTNPRFQRLLLNLLKRGGSGHVRNSPLFTWKHNDPLLGHTPQIREFF